MAAPAGRTETVHATCILVREAGILIRGPSGAGKSTLAQAAVDAAEAAGLHAAHLADDRVRLEVRGGRLVARPVPAIAGQLELRGIGIVRVPAAPAAVVRLLVDLSPEPPPRLPEPDELRCVLLGVPLPRLLLGREGALPLLLWRLRGLHDTGVTDP